MKFEMPKIVAASVYFGSVTCGCTKNSEGYCGITYRVG